MPARQTRKGFSFGWNRGENGWKDGHDQTVQNLQYLVQGTVIRSDLFTPPPTVSEGDVYAIPAASTPTGAWAGHAGHLAGWDGSTWDFLIPERGWKFYDSNTGVDIEFNGTEYVQVTQKPKTHTHVITEVTGLRGELDGLDARVDAIEGGDLFVRQDDLEAPDGAGLVGFGESTVQDGADRNLNFYGGVGNDSTNNDAAFAAAVANNDVRLPDGKFRISSEIPTNTRGVPVTGPGSLMVPVDQGDLTKGYHRYPFVEDEHQRWFGLEYLFPLHAAWKSSPSAAPKIYMCGDSTINGDSIVQSEWLPDNALRSAILRRGFKSTIVKKAISGTTVAQFNDQMSNAEIDDAVAIVISFGINDTFPPPESWDFVGVPEAGVPKYPSFDAFVQAYRNALARIRGRRNELECAIIIKTSNVINDTQHNRDEWQAHRQRRALRKLARDYKCCLIDIPMYIGDTRPNPLIDNGRTVMPTGKWAGTTQLAPGWMDDPFRTIEAIRDPRCYGNGIHPLETANIWIWGIVADVLCGTVREIANNNWLIDAAANLNPSTAPSLYPTGASTYRARLADGWPLDGMAHTIKDNAGNCIQWHYATGADNADYYVRISKNGTTWGSWATNWWINDTTLDVNASTIPDLYRFGATTYRAKVSEGWPVEGYVHTIREPLGDAIQFNWSKDSKAPSVRHRVSYNGGANWGAWSVFTETPTLLNGWVNVAATTQFRLTRRDGMAHLSGIIGSGVNTVGTVLFALPAGAAPRDDIFLIAWDATGTGFGVIKVNGTGNSDYDLVKNVEIYKVSPTGYFNLSGCSWQTAYEM